MSIEQAKRFREARATLAKLEKTGVCFELTPDGRDFEFWTEAGDVEPDTLREIADRRDLILEALRDWDKTLERFHRAWMRFPSPYRVLED